MKALVPLRGVSTDPDPAGFAQFLAMGHFLEGRTHFRGVAPLAAGSVLVAEAGGLRTVRYWTPVFRHDRGVPDRVHAERIRTGLAAAVAERTDGRTAMMLSGGTDSRVLAALLPESPRTAATRSASGPAWPVRSRIGRTAGRG